MDLEPGRGTTVSSWIRRPRNPVGTLPKGLINKVGIIGGAVVMALVIITSPASDEEGEAAASGEAAGGDETGVQPAGGETLVRSTSAAIERLKTQAERLRAAREREEGRRRQAATAGGTIPLRPRSGEPGPLPGVVPSGPPGPETPEQQLREELRLAEIRRAHEALRSPVVALSLRPASAQGEVAAGSGREAPTPPGEPDPPPAGRAAGASPEELAELRVPASAQGVPEPADAAPTPATQPRDPAGWERIFEGQILEAVLATRLRGDFSGPVVAIVSSPLWSRDRQRILIPRGTRALGTAAAVGEWQQARLAVAFHRLVFPDGRYIRLEFGGLDQAGATGLQDRVNRHYLATLGAAGAVGVISGLTLRGSQPYAGGADGARAGAGIGMGRAAETILDRYLNRLPTVTIRAGQRLRILFTADALVPRPAFRLRSDSRRTP